MNAVLMLRFVYLPDFASVMAPHSSKTNASVNPNSDKSDSSSASAKSIVFSLDSLRSKICDAKGHNHSLLFMT